MVSGRHVPDRRPPRPMNDGLFRRSPRRRTAPTRRSLLVRQPDEPRRRPRLRDQVSPLPSCAVDGDSRCEGVIGEGVRARLHPDVVGLARQPRQHVGERGRVRVAREQRAVRCTARRRRCRRSDRRPGFPSRRRTRARRPADCRRCRVCAGGRAGRDASASEPASALAADDSGPVAVPPHAIRSAVADHDRRERAPTPPSETAASRWPASPLNQAKGRWREGNPSRCREASARAPSVLTSAPCTSSAAISRGSSPARSTRWNAFTGGGSVPGKSRRPSWRRTCAASRARSSGRSGSWSGGAGRSSTCSSATPRASTCPRSAASAPAAAGSAACGWCTRTCATSR